jgi:hypothetical protein
MPLAPTPPPAPGGHLWGYLLAAGFMALIAALSLTIRENYPFSHFPMYGNPNSRPVDYYFLTDGTGQPLPVAALTGETAPRIKKRMLTQEFKFVKDHHLKDRTAIPPENLAAIRSRVLSSFVTQARSRGTPLPAEIQLWKGLIHQHNQGYSESFEQEAAVSTATPSTP